jgi:hypothetical protein
MLAQLVIELGFFIKHIKSTTQGAEEYQNYFSMPYLMVPVQYLNGLYAA